MKRMVINSFVIISMLLVASLVAQEAKLVNVARHQVPSFIGYVPDEIVVNFGKSILNVLDETSFSSGKTGVFALDQLGGKYQFQEKHYKTGN